MAEQRRSGRKKGVPHHPLVEALASDPNQPPARATKLFGFPGPAAAAGSTRLWLDADLSSYVDVPDDAILHSRTLENDQGTTLWVDPSATLTYSRTQSHEVQADFLKGSIVQGNLGAAMPAPGGAPLRVDRPTLSPQFCLQPVTSSPPCQTWGPWWCPQQLQTPVVLCDPQSWSWRICPPTGVVPCEPSVAVLCGQTVDVRCAPSVNVNCVPSVAGRCQSDAICGNSIACDPFGPFKPIKPVR
jgi:hypothetical protein